MSRIMLIGLSAVFLLASSVALSRVASAEANPNASRVNKVDHYVKRGKQQKKGGDPAGLAVSDPGAEGTKPVKGKKH